VLALRIRGAAANFLKVCDPDFCLPLSSPLQHIFVSQDRTRFIVVAETGLSMRLVTIADKDPEDVDASDEYPSPGECCSPKSVLDHAHPDDPR